MHNKYTDLMFDLLEVRMLQVLVIKRQAHQAGHTFTSACLWGISL